MKLTYISLFCLLILAACKKEKQQEETPIVSTCAADVYCFQRNGHSTVDYSGQTARLLQMDEMIAYAKTAVNGQALSAAQLQDMFTNGNGAGSTYFSNEAGVPGKALNNKCFLPSVAVVQQLFIEMAETSANGNVASNGVAGIATSTSDPSKKYMLDSNGFEYVQLIEKGLMGDVFYYQAFGTYMSAVSSGELQTGVAVDAAAGKHYSEAEHAFDEAFGYFGVPVDFPSNTSGLKYYGKYCNGRNAALSSNAIMTSFLNARKALVGGEIDQTSIQNISKHWQRVIAGTIIHYLIEAKETDDLAVKCHVLSEAWAFMGNMLHNGPNMSWSPAELVSARTLLGDNLYLVTNEMIDAAILFVVDNSEIELVEIAYL
ncbi:MAG: DUF4856 domain-containing protein [Flavobacteriales bacterium]|nr:DUF4856 domain-containing protein [Flavobacteriales bacterium]